jgi:4-amino-4-deoxy-L-arabinose transferase-like glycosyltransferase
MTDPAPHNEPAPPGGEPRAARRDRIALAAVLALALLVRLIGLGRQSIWVDEAYSFNYARPDGPLTARLLLENLHGPLHAMILHEWIKLFGTSEISIRFPSVLASLGSLAVFFFLARRRWGRSVAWVGLILMTLAPFHVWYAQESRNYAFLILFALLAEWAYERVAREGPRGANLARYGLALLAGFLSNLSMALLVLVHAARPAGARLRGRLILVWALVALCLTPWGIAFYQRQVRPSELLTTEAPASEEKLRQGTTDTPLGIPYTIYTFATGFSFGPSRREMWLNGPLRAVRHDLGMILLAAAVFGTLWLRGVRRVWRANRSEAISLLVWQALPVLAVFAISLRNLKVINPRYAAVAYPAFVATLALGVPGRRGRLGYAVFAGALVISIVSLVRAFALPTYWKEDTRDAAAWLRRNLAPGDALVTLAVDMPLRDYYMREELHGKRPVAWENLGRIVVWRGRFAKRYEAEVLPAWTPGRRLFVFVEREWAVDPRGEMERDLLSRGRLLEERHWPGARVLVLERLSEGEDGAPPSMACAEAPR